MHSDSYPLYVNWDAMQHVLLSSLQEDLLNLEDSLRTVALTNEGYVFSNDAEEDKAQIKNLLTALKHVVNYYGGKEEVEDVHVSKVLTDSAIKDMCKQYGWDDSYQSMKAYRTVEDMSLKLNARK